MINIVQEGMEKPNELILNKKIQRIRNEIKDKYIIHSNRMMKLKQIKY